MLVHVRSSGPLCYAMVYGMSVGDGLCHNFPSRWNAAPSQHLLVIRRNTGEVSLDPLRWGLIPYWCTDPKGINAKCETVRGICPPFREGLPQTPLHRAGGRLLRMEGGQGQKVKQRYAIAMKPCT